jgi:hypothetical protein
MLGCQLSVVSRPDRLHCGVKREVDPGSSGTSQGATAPPIACGSRRARTTYRACAPRGRHAAPRRTPRLSLQLTPCLSLCAVRWLCPQPMTRRGLHPTLRLGAQRAVAGHASRAAACGFVPLIVGPAPCAAAEFASCGAADSASALGSHPALLPSLRRAPRPGLWLHSAPHVTLRFVLRLGQRGVPRPVLRPVPGPSLRIVMRLSLLPALHQAHQPARQPGLCLHAVPRATRRPIPRAIPYGMPRAAPRLALHTHLGVRWV